MKTTDIVFYLSVAGMVWLKVGEQVKGLVSAPVFSWMSIVFGAVAVIAFAFYEKINGNPPVPPQQ